MGVILKHFLCWIPLISLSSVVLYAEPTLRLTTAAAGPVSVAAGGDGPQQVIEAYNAGDGSLALSVKASADWLVPVVRPPAPCTSRAGACLPIAIDLRTSGLPPGVHTGAVTVTDPQAFDAPQTVTVTVQMGGGVPASAEFFAAPNGAADDLYFNTNSLLGTTTSTGSGGPWLSIAMEGFGSFLFVYPYRLTARPLAGMAEGTYRGALNVTQSSFPPDVKNVAVTFRVTSEPIAALQPARLQIRVAQNTIQPQAVIVVKNRGLGTLAITGVQATAGSGGNWLSAQKADTGNIVVATADTANTAPGRYQGTIEIASNAVNGPLRVPVELEVTAQGPPLASFGGVVNNNIFESGDTIGQGSIASAFGEQFIYSAPQQGKVPLAADLGGVKVFVNGVAAPLYFASYGQINFEMPQETPPGEARVTVMRENQVGNTVTVTVAGRAPRLLRLGIGNYGIIVNQDGTFPIPPLAGVLSRRARAGDALVIYGIGFGKTDPPVADGAASPAAEPLARIVPAPKVYFGAGLTGGAVAEPFFAGLTPNFVGLFQVNVVIPDNAPRIDNVPLRVEGPGYVSNVVELAIE